MNTVPIRSELMKNVVPFEQVGPHAIIKHLHFGGYISNYFMDNLGRFIAPSNHPENAEGETQ
jgi:hypothetical protein